MIKIYEITDIGTPLWKHIVYHALKTIVLPAAGQTLEQERGNGNIFQERKVLFINENCILSVGAYVAVSKDICSFENISKTHYWKHWVKKYIFTHIGQLANEIMQEKGFNPLAASKVKEVMSLLWFKQPTKFKVFSNTMSVTISKEDVRRVMVCKGFFIGRKGVHNVPSLSGTTSTQ